MTNKETHSTLDIPNAAINQKGRGISAIWVIPIIATLIAGWLVFKSATEKKTIIDVTFKSASGLEAGKTVVKLRNIKIGAVKEIKFSNDLSKVIVTIEFDGISQEQLTDTTRFWVVRPQIGLGGVSGLDTLLSGAYIEADPGHEGQPINQFTGMEQPDIYQRGEPGTQYILRTKNLGSLSRGSPIKFRDIDVGKVIRYELTENHKDVEIGIFIFAPHDKYINKKTRFWNVSGLDIKVDANGLQLDMASVASLIRGGIAFSTSNSLQNIAQAPAQTAFNLYATEKPKIEETLTFVAPMKLYFDEGVSGLSINAPVEFKGLRVGTVSDIGVELDSNRTELLTYAMINIEPDRLPNDVKLTNISDEQRMKGVYKFFENMVSKGMRAHLKSGNLLTGQSLIALDIFSSAKKATINYADGLPILPTVPETLSSILAQANTLMSRVDGILVEVDGILSTVETMPLKEIGVNIEQTTASANSLIKSFNAAEGGMLGTQMQQMLNELAKAARSIRAMTDYLERHPEALLKGKKPR